MAPLNRAKTSRRTEIYVRVPRLERLRNDRGRDQDVDGSSSTASRPPKVYDRAKLRNLNRRKSVGMRIVDQQRNVQSQGEFTHDWGDQGGETDGESCSSTSSGK
jgi:hypothetical protein